MNQFKVGCDFLKDAFGLLLTVAFNKPFYGVASAFAVVASAFAVTQWNYVCGNCTGVRLCEFVVRVYGNPMIGGNLVTVSGRSAAYGAAPMPVIQTAQPIGFGETIRQIILAGAPPMFARLNRFGMILCVALLSLGDLLSVGFTVYPYLFSYFVSLFLIVSFIVLAHFCLVCLSICRPITALIFADFSGVHFAVSSFRLPNLFSMFFTVVFHTSYTLRMHTVTALSVAIEVFRRGREIFTTLGTAFGGGVHSVSLSLSHILSVSGGVSAAFRPVGLDTKPIIAYSVQVRY